MVGFVYCSGLDWIDSLGVEWYIALLGCGWLYLYDDMSHDCSIADMVSHGDGCFGAGNWEYWMIQYIHHLVLSPAS